ncbi:MAG TPA: hypothetical protein VHS55_00030 [Solirubrobacteraceae bacterium]|jgi:hypothetical protein|nr:hypothetical protein [Solirubrobacteraceae bacterium]
MRAADVRARILAGVPMAGGAVPGFDDPALASLPPGGNLYFQADAALAAPTVGIPTAPGAVQQLDRTPPQLMFGTPANTTSSGEPIVKASSQSSGTGHFSEVLNFHGSPAPWVLLGILIVAGLLHLEAGASGKVKL